MWRGRRRTHHPSTEHAARTTSLSARRLGLPCRNISAKKLSRPPAIAKSASALVLRGGVVVIRSDFHAARISFECGREGKLSDASESSFRGSQYLLLSGRCARLLLWRQSSSAARASASRAFSSETSCKRRANARPEPGALNAPSLPSLRDTSARRALTPEMLALTPSSITVMVGFETTISATHALSASVSSSEDGCSAS